MVTSERLDRCKVNVLLVMVCPGCGRAADLWSECAGCGQRRPSGFQELAQQQAFALLQRGVYMGEEAVH